MIEVQELRIGNVVSSDKLEKTVKVCGTSQEGFILVDNDSGTLEKIDKDQISPLDLNENTIQLLQRKSIITESGNLYYFNGLRTTYFLVYDDQEANFFMGMIDTNLPEGYRRLTRPFSTFHKLQNAFYVIFDRELKSIV